MILGKGNQKEADVTFMDVLEEYVDIRDDLEDTLQSFELLSAEIGFAMDDIRDELEQLQEHLHRSSEQLRKLECPVRHRGGAFHKIDKPMLHEFD